MEVKTIKNPKFGDYQLNIRKLAKELGKDESKMIAKILAKMGIK